jgi:mono/diheme cytochrome c family protein
MERRVRRFFIAAAVLWVAATLGIVNGGGVSAERQATTNDGVYSKAQAEGAKAQFDKLCAECHAFTVAAKKKPKDLPLGDEPFFETWTGRPLSQMVTTIALTMPNDGSAAVTDQEALDLVAYILQQNGFPAGDKPLTKESAAATIARPKKNP